MKRYKKFSVRSFIKDRKRWDDEIAELEAELEAERGLNSIEGGGRSGKISRPTESEGIKCMQTQEEIGRRKMYRTAWKYAEAKLNDRERELLAGFYDNKHKLIREFVYDYSMKYGVNTRYVYRDKREMEEHIYQELKDAEFDVW